jgi:hypothetical protein
MESSSERNPYTAPEAPVTDVSDALLEAGARRYYTPWQITVATLLGGSLAGGVLARQNHILFGDSRKAIVILVVSIAVLICSIVAGITMPPHISRSVGAIVIASAYRWYAVAAFAGRIANAKAHGWQQHSWWRVIGISAAILAGILLVLVLGMSQF